MKSWLPILFVILLAAILVHGIFQNQRTPPAFVYTVDNAPIQPPQWMLSAAWYPKFYRTFDFFWRLTHEPITAYPFALLLMILGGLPLWQSRSGRNLVLALAGVALMIVSVLP